MRIRILKQTRYNDNPLRVGDVVDVEVRTAARWLRHGIAEEIAETPAAPSEDTGGTPSKPSTKPAARNSGKKKGADTPPPSESTPQGNEPGTGESEQTDDDPAGNPEESTEETSLTGADEEHDAAEKAAETATDSISGGEASVGTDQGENGQKNGETAAGETGKKTAPGTGRKLAAVAAAADARRQGE